MSNIHDPFRYELEKYSRSYPSTSSTSNQWTHISRPNVFVYLENMFPAGIIVAGVGEPILKVIADQNTLLECLNVSYRHANILKAKALLRSPTIGIRYNYSIVDRNGVTTAQEVRKFQLRFKTIEDFEACAGIIGRYISCKPILGNGSNVSSSTSDLGLSNHAQVLNKIQPPLSVMQQQITKPQKEQSVALTTRQESCQKEYIVLDSPSRPSTSSSTSSFAATTDISSKPLQRSCTDISFQTPITQKSVTNILESTNQSLYNPQISPLPQRIDQRQTSPIQTTNNLEFHTLNQPSSSNESNDFNSSQKAVNSMDPVKEHMNLVKEHSDSLSFPNDDDELQAWIMNILKDPEYPQFVSRVEKLWKARLMM